MTSRLPAKTDTVMVTRNLHLEQVASVIGLNIDLLRALNPMYRRDIVPGATEPYPLRLPQTEIGKFLDMEDSIYSYRANELLTKRAEVEVRDDVPTYYKRSKSSVRGRKARYTRGRKATASRRATASRKRSTAAGKRSAASKKRSTAAKKSTTTKRKRRR
jgi:membrane-bound lytic murein transglycosylase D